ncbi:hypothetical protein E3N88_15787 [Mikania micrantha]|uniref:Uncharacterized protein n=1 Tax=Mikania micrantha TaxID=192012 RepID=A0A5N6NXQ5_9ASTR|nr:hypothetical protein E3N88_15787 [Mikania micrantha]
MENTLLASTERPNGLIYNSPSYNEHPLASTERPCDTPVQTTLERCSMIEKRARMGPEQQNKLIGLEIQARRPHLKLETTITFFFLSNPAISEGSGAAHPLFWCSKSSRRLPVTEACYLTFRSLRLHTTSSLRMADSNINANRSAARPTGTDDLAAESRRRIDDIVAQVDAEMDRRARDAARARYWGWLPTILQSWIVEERVPPYRYPGDTTPGHRLPPFGVPMEQAFAAHVACTRREVWRGRELTDEVRVLREKND